LPTHEFVGSADPRIALEKIAALRPHIVLADWFQSDGAQLIEWLKKIRVMPIPPVFLMEDDPTGVNTRKMRQQAQRHGAAGFIPRPLTETRLHTYINAACYRLGLPVSGLFIALPTHQGPRDPLLDALSQSPHAVIAEDVGGWPVLNAILQSTYIRSNPMDLARLHAEMEAWGSLREEDRLARAEEYVCQYAEAQRDAYEETLFCLASVMLGRGGECSSIDGQF
jgi:CheY-like chemotaxis protein